MSDSSARDPVFGEIARALQPRARAQSAVPKWMVEVAWMGVSLRAAGLDLEERRQLEALRALTPVPGGRLMLGCPRFVMAEIKPQTEALLALQAAHDNATAPFASPRVMGIVNVTPDSFSDGGSFADADAAIEHGLKLVADGAALLDIGGESTRPGAESVDEIEELRRVLPVVRGLKARTQVPLSIDTQKSSVARAALDAGASIVNDVSAGRFDARMLPLVAERGATLVLMHMQGTPRDMQSDPQYDDVVSDVLEFLRERAARCLDAGIARERIWIDPGIGFGKRLEHNLALVRDLSQLRSLGLPIVLGVSRKGFIAALHAPAKDDTSRVGGTAAAVTVGVQGGAEILRVHDVAVMTEAIAIARALSNHAPTPWP